MNRYQKYLLPVLVLSLLVALALVFRSFFITNIITPIAVLFWAVWRVILSVDQNIYWAILITGCAVLAVRLISFGDRQSSNPAYNYQYPSPNRVAYWQTLINDLSYGKDQAEELQTNLRKLFLTAIEETKRSEADLEEVLATSQMQLSVRAKRFLNPEKQTGRPLLLGFIIEWLNRLTGRSARENTAAINELLEWMESEMELRNDQ